MFEWLHQRRERKEEAASTEFLGRMQDPRNVVTELRQRIFEDPEFKTGLLESMQRARVAADADALALAEKFTALSDRKDQIIPSLQKTNGEALRSIFDSLLLLVVDTELQKVTPDEVVREIAGEVGRITWNSYCEGQDIMQALRGGAIAAHLQGVGTVVVWERGRDLGVERLDAISATYQQMNNPGASN